MCAIDGQLLVALVPPTQRQEVYPSLLNQSVYWDQYLSKSAQSNASPVNFFIPDSKSKYKHF